MRHLILALLLALLAQLTCSAQNPIRISDIASDAVSTNSFMTELDGNNYLITLNLYDTISLYRIDGEDLILLHEGYAPRSYIRGVEFFMLGEYLCWHEDYHLYSFNLITKVYDRTFVPYLSYISTSYPIAGRYIYFQYNWTPNWVSKFDIQTKTIEKQDDIVRLFSALRNGVLAQYRKPDSSFVTGYIGADGAEFDFEFKDPLYTQSSARGAVFTWVKEDKLLRFVEDSLKVETLLTSLNSLENSEVFVNDDATYFLPGNSEVHIYSHDKTVPHIRQLGANFTAGQFKIVDDRVYTTRLNGYDFYRHNLSDGSSTKLGSLGGPHIKQSIHKRYVFLDQDSCVLYDTHKDIILPFEEEDFCYPYMYFELNDSVTFISPSSLWGRLGMHVLRDKGTSLVLEPFDTGEIQRGITKVGHLKSPNYFYVFANDNTYSVNGTTFEESALTNSAEFLKHSSDYPYPVYARVSDEILYFGTFENQEVILDSVSFEVDDVRIIGNNFYYLDEDVVLFSNRPTYSTERLMFFDRNTREVKDLVNSKSASFHIIEDNFYLNTNDELIHISKSGDMSTLMQQTKRGTFFPVGDTYFYTVDGDLFQYKDPLNLEQVDIGLSIRGIFPFNKSGAILRNSDGNSYYFSGTSPLYRSDPMQHRGYDGEHFLLKKDSLVRILNAVSGASMDVVLDDNHYTSENLFIDGSDTLIFQNEIFDTDLRIWHFSADGRELITDLPKFGQDAYYSYKVSKAPSGQVLLALGNTLLFKSDDGEFKILDVVLGRSELLHYFDSAFYFSGVHPTLGNQIYYLPLSSDPNVTEEPMPLTTSPLSVYPNPASSQINVSCPDCPTQPTHYEIMSIDGPVLHGAKFQEGRPINITMLPAGTFIFVAYWPDGQPTASAVFIKS